MSTTILSYIQLQIIRYATPIILILGNLGNICIIISFSRRRQSSCAMYLLFNALFNSFYLTFNVSLSLYGLYYGNPTSSNLILCKCRYYLSQTWNQTATTFAILACIDRFALVTRHKYLQLINKSFICRIIIGITCISWHTLLIPTLFFVTIENRSCTFIGIYYLIYSIYIAIFLSLIPPILMIIFGLLSYHNMTQLHTRIRPMMSNDIVIIHRRDRQLFLLVLAQAIVYVLTIFPYPFIVLEVTITNQMGIQKSVQWIQIENFLSIIGVVLTYISCATPFYTYFVASKTFRKDFLNSFTQCQHQ
ncbi:unnamed protein product [Adineta ricciae]|uniref:G-protein coupled receptors family 1 profile domain-containing protein n=2 Tax=Adineta ricciae TaxID=249248 RepID=A0A815N3K9_ADIRI|nr:unnamed protein product [Adineta ricciae]